MAFYKMITDRKPCSNPDCEKTILAATAERTGGVCMPCFQEANASERCDLCKSDTPYLTYLANNGICMSCLESPPEQLPELELTELPLRLENFTRADTSDREYKVDIWRYDKCVVTNLGRSRIRLETFDGGEPDAKMLSMLNDGIRTLLDRSDKILDIIYEDYEECVDQQADHLDQFYDVGSETSRDKICDFIEDLSVYVYRNLTDKYTAEQYRSRWFCGPEWDDEHCIYINLANNLEREDC